MVHCRLDLLISFFVLCMLYAYVYDIVCSLEFGETVEMMVSDDRRKLLE